jgi:hypothetical protein
MFENTEHKCIIIWNIETRYRFIKDAISVILILLHEKVVKFCLIVVLINSRFSKVEGGGGAQPLPPKLEEGGRPQATPHFYSTVYNYTGL